MSMTKKDYEIISAVIASTTMSPRTKFDLVENFSKTLARDNPHFKKELFEKASGVYSCRICEKNGQSFKTTFLPDSQAHFIIHLNAS